MTCRLSTPLPLALPGTRLTSFAVVLVVPTEEVEGIALGAHFVPSSRRPVEPLVHAPKRVEPARVRGVRVVDDAVLERERAHAGPLPRIGGPVGARGGGPRSYRSLCGCLLGRLRWLVAEVVFNWARPLLFLCQGDV